MCLRPNPISCGHVCLSTRHRIVLARNRCVSAQVQSDIKVSSGLGVNTPLVQSVALPTEHVRAKVDSDKSQRRASRCIVTKHCCRLHTGQFLLKPPTGSATDWTVAGHAAYPHTNHQLIVGPAAFR